MADEGPRTTLDLVVRLRWRRRPLRPPLPPDDPRLQAMRQQRWNGLWDRLLTPLSDETVTNEVPVEQAD